MAQAIGIVDLVWRGTKIPIEKGASVELGGLKQDAVITGRQVDYSREMMESTISATTRFNRGDSLITLWAGGQGELQVLCDTGQTYVWPDAFLSNRPNFTGGDGGKVKLEWKAGIPEELQNG